jgi:hypothetical protein
VQVAAAIADLDTLADAPDLDLGTVEAPHAVTRTDPVRYFFGA